MPIHLSPPDLRTTWPFEKWFLPGLLVVLVVLLANGWTAIQNTRQLKTDAYWVAHTQETLDALDELVSTMKDAETGQRGYLITGEDAYLEPYNTARLALDDKLARVRGLAADNERQRARLPQLTQLAQEKLDELTRTIALRRDSGFEAAQREVATHLGKNKMDALRAAVLEMENEESRLLTERKKTNSRTYTLALVSGSIASLTALIAVLGFIGALRREMSARRIAATLLHQQREWFRTTLASIGDAVIATDTDGRITFLNPVAAELTAWPAEQAIGVPLEEVFKIINEQTRQTVEDPSRKALREGTVVGLANHTILVARDGVEKPIDDSAAPIRDEQNHIVGVVLVFRDITERRRGELALQDADRAKNEFLATLSHELRNPLAPIRNALELLRRDPDDVALINQSRAMMERQISQLVRLVDDLLEVSRISSGKMQLRKERVELSAVVHNALEATRPLIASAGHELSVALPPAPVYLDADPARLAQVIANLLSNAAKYMERKGQIRLQAERRDGELIVSVHDTGIGIAPENLNRVFEMFAQLEPALERSQGGLGIGLSLVRGLVELHGGSVEAHSEGLGKGSTFVIHLPIGASSAAAAPAPADAGAAPVARRCRILVVDDNRDSAGWLQRLLRMDGHETQAVFDGVEAVQRVASFRPDIVLLDIGLPRLNGYEAARQIRQQPWGKRTTLIALTGWGQEDDKRRAQEAGFDHHLTKPVDPGALEKLLAQIAPEVSASTAPTGVL